LLLSIVVPLFGGPAGFLEFGPHGGIAVGKFFYGETLCLVIGQAQVGFLTYKGFLHLH